jgi:hypothetical protein
MNKIAPLKNEYYRFANDRAHTFDLKRYNDECNKEGSGVAAASLAYTTFECMEKMQDLLTSVSSLKLAFERKLHV